MGEAIACPAPPLLTPLLLMAWYIFYYLSSSSLQYNNNLKFKIITKSKKDLVVLSDLCTFFPIRLWIKTVPPHCVQVNLSQKHSFLNQLTQNMTTDCSLINNFLPRKIQVQNMLGTKIVYCLRFDIQNNFCTQCVLNLYLSRTELIIQWTICFILWVNWCKNKCFWKRFTCKLTVFG